MSVEPFGPTPNHLALPDDEFERRIEDLRTRYTDCDLCAYDCRVERQGVVTGDAPPGR